MSSALRRVRLPPAAQGWDARLSLKRWVGSIAWDPAPRYGVIDRMRESLLGLNLPDLADDPETIVTATFQALLMDEQFKHYVIVDCTQDLTQAEEWEGAARAYAWVVLQRYNRDLGGQDD